MIIRTMGTAALAIMPASAPALGGVSALAMGNSSFTDLNGEEVKVEYPFGYVRGEDGRLLINLHHASLPYSVN